MNGKLGCVVCGCAILSWTLVACGDGGGGGGGSDPTTTTGGRSSSRGGTGGNAGVAAGGAAGMGNAGGEAAAGGTSDPDPPDGSSADGSPEPPSVSSPVAVEDVWGAQIVVDGAWLGSSGRSNVFVVITGEAGTLTLTPSDPEVIEWSESRIVFRVPFPFEGDISIETPQGVVAAGSFASTWRQFHKSMPAAAEVISTLSPTARHADLLVDSGSLLSFDDGDFAESLVPLESVAGDTARLFLSESGAVEAFGISGGTAPEIIRLAMESGSYGATPTGIATEAEDVAVAGGLDGATVWMDRADGWWRARPLPTWAIDKGPIDDPNPSAPDHASGATSDGSLFVGYSVDTGSLFDDMEAANVRQLQPTATTFDASVRATRSVDDYLTSLDLMGRGPGLLVRYCGSDVDPFGLTNSSYRCFTSARTSQGASARTLPNEGPNARIGFTDRVIAVAYCDGDDSLRFTTDYANDPGEVVLWPCQQLVSLVIDPDRNPIVVVASGTSWHALVRKSPGGSEPISPDGGVGTMLDGGTIDGGENAVSDAAAPDAG